MDNSIQAGLIVSAIGLIVTFTALGIFIGVIVLLQKLFPPKPEVVESVKAQPIVALTDASPENNDSDEALVAVLAAAAYLRSRRSDQLGSALLAGPGRYRTSRN
jgi:Na+-transporting methylmalonyl-CoA/oxaloacetate decarboxylase gamma subunit